jgi:hypothetical protein
MWGKEERDAYDKNFEDKVTELDKVQENIAEFEKHAPINAATNADYLKKLAPYKKKEASLKKEIENIRKDPKAKTDFYKPKRARELDEEIEMLSKRRKELAIPGLSIADARAWQEQKARGKKDVPDTENAEELIAVADSALKTGDTGLAAEAFLKTTKNADYNEILSYYNCGTGKDGLMRLADILQKQGTFDRQTAFKLIAEIGGIAKNIGHFAAYGAVKMKNGEWEEASDDEYNAAMLAEMVKVDPQQFLRNYNRMAVGQYVDTTPGVEKGKLDKSKHDVDHYQLTPAGVAWWKLYGGSEDALVKTIRERGNQNMLEYSMSQQAVINEHLSEKVKEAMSSRVADPGAKNTDSLRVIQGIREDLQNYFVSHDK